MKKIMFIAIVCFAGLMCFAQSAGSKVKVLWGTSWYDATVVEAGDGQWLIHYEGYDDEWDEWVGPDRMQFSYKVGDKLLVEWKAEWWDATILKIENGKYYIHYDGWDAKWDEWVTTARMRSK